MGSQLVSAGRASGGRATSGSKNFSHHREPCTGCEGHQEKQDLYVTREAYACCQESFRCKGIVKHLFRTLEPALRCVPSSTSARIGHTRMEARYSNVGVEVQWCFACMFTVHVLRIRRKMNT